MVATRSKILPIVWGGLSNQINAIKETMVVASVLGADIIVPPLIGSWSLQKRGRDFYRFFSVFDQNHFISECKSRLDVSVYTLSSVDKNSNQSVQRINAPLKGAEDLAASLEAEIALLNFMGIRASDVSFDATLDIADPITAKAELIDQVGFSNKDIIRPMIMLAGAGRLLTMGGLGSVQEASCDNNYCGRCLPNPEFSEVRLAANACFEYSREIAQLGDEFINKYFGRRRFLAAHIRADDFPRHRPLDQCNSGISSDDVLSCITQVVKKERIRASDVFLAVPRSFFTQVSELGTLKKNYVFESTSFVEDDSLRSWVDQYVATKATAFLASDYNRPNLNYHSHQHSAWSSIVTEYRKLNSEQPIYYFGQQLETLKNKLDEDSISKDDSLELFLERPKQVRHARRSSQLAVGDYIPNFYAKNGNMKLDIQSIAGVSILLFCVADKSRIDIISEIFVGNPKRRIIFLAPTADVASGRAETFWDEAAYALLATTGVGVTGYRLSRNLKIIDKIETDDPRDIYGLVLAEPEIDLHPPVLIVPDVVSQDLADRLINYSESHEEQAHKDSSGYKSRLHVHPDRKLIEELDSKLVKSLLPEINKVFYSSVTHRETYKICKYAGSEGGTFGKHRDTIGKFLYRRYAVSIILNDDYVGGGIAFPEYSGRVIDAPRLSAVVFPGSLYHEVQRISEGSRYVIISFLFGDAEVDGNEELEKYRFSVSRDLSGLVINRITPLSY